MKRIYEWGRRVVLGFVRNNCTMHAAGLTYFSMLALVPILCCILVVAKICKVDHHARDQINAHIDAFIVNIEKGQEDPLAQLTPADEESRRKKQIAAEEFAKQARQISNALFERIDSFDVGTFGWIGFGFLLWTVIASLGNVEASFNQIWNVPKPRPIWRRAYLYLFIIIVLPILATVALSLPILNVAKNVILATLGATWLTHWVSDGLIWILDSLAFRLTFSLAAASLAFGFFFWVMPNCKVRFRHAWYGGLITSVLFGGWLKICAVAQVGIAKSSALYGSFAFVPIILAWLYMSWQIILLGEDMVRAFDVLADGSASGTALARPANASEADDKNRGKEKPLNPKGQAQS